MLTEQALTLACSRKEYGRQAYALRLLGEIAAQRDPPEAEEAECRYRQALALAEELGMRPLQAHCHLGLGTLFLRMWRQEDARTELTAATELYHVMEMTFWLPETERTLAAAEGQKAVGNGFSCLPKCPHEEGGRSRSAGAETR